MKRFASGSGTGRTGPRGSALLEEREQRLWGLVGDGERLNTKLLLHLKRLKPGRSLLHVGVDKRADAGFQRVDQARDEIGLGLDPALNGTEGRGGVDGRLKQALDAIESCVGTVVGCDVEFSQQFQAATDGSVGFGFPPCFRR